MKRHPDINDTLRSEGPEGVRGRHDRARKVNGSGEHESERAKANGHATGTIIRATPYVWRDPKTILPRDFLYGFHFIRGNVGGTIAPGGLGKSTEIQSEIAAMITGRELLGVAPKQPLRVWYINLEDSLAEIDRRMSAAFLKYKVTPTEIANRLFVDSGREVDLIIARDSKAGLKLDDGVIHAINVTIEDNGIDVVVIDPFVNSVEVPENDNNKMARVVRCWVDIAEKNDCAVEIVHHVRKGGNSREPFTVDDARGAVSFINACRSVRILNRMTQQEGEKAGVTNYRRFFRIDNGKANLTPAPEAAEWRELVSVSLDNATKDRRADDIGVAILWKWPDLMESLTVAELRAAQKAVDEGGPWRKDTQAKMWVGIPIAKALDLDPKNKAHANKIKGALEIWIRNGMFRPVEGFDDQRKAKIFIKVGKWAD